MGCHTELKFSIGEVIGYILFRWVLKSVFLGNYHKTKVEGHPLKWWGRSGQVRSQTSLGSRFKSYESFPRHRPLAVWAETCLGYGDPPWYDKSIHLGARYSNPLGREH